MTSFWLYQLGEKHLSVAKTMTQIGAVHLELSNYDTAMSILTEAEEYQLATVGEHHRDTFETQTLLGRVYSAIGKFDLALVKLHGVAENQIKMFGENHPSVSEHTTVLHYTNCYVLTLYVPSLVSLDRRDKSVYR